MMFGKVGWKITLNVIFLILKVTLASCKWPLEPKKWSERPVLPEACHYERTPFCENGFKPILPINDSLTIYYFTNPVMKSHFGDAFAYINAYHSLLGFESQLLGMNFTLEYYAFGAVLNTTFPKINFDSSSENNFTWCQQAATCLHPGIIGPTINQNNPDNFDGYIVTLGKIGTKNFYSFLEEFNNNFNKTYPIYNGINIHYKPEGQVWIDSMDCADYVKLAIQALVKAGAEFNLKDTPSIRLTKMTLYSEAPEFLGDNDTIFSNPTLLKKITDFFEIGKATNSQAEMIKRLIMMFYHLFISPFKEGYLYYNGYYWRLKPRYPYGNIIYTDWAIPLQ